MELPAKARAAWLAAATGGTWVAGDAKANPELAVDARCKASEAYPQGRDQVKASELYQRAVRGCAVVANASRTTALELLKAADKLTGEERPRQAAEAGRHAADAYVHSAQHHERAAQIMMQAGQGSEVVVPAWRQAEASWRAAATTYEMAEQPESARQADASARAAALQAVRRRDVLAFLQQIPTTGQIQVIKNRIAAQLCPPRATGSREGRFTASRIEFLTDQGNDVYYQTEFIRHDHTEWLGLRIGDTIVHPIPAETALLIIGHFRHSVERRVVELEDFVRGSNLADLLRPIAAPPEGGGAEPLERQANPR